MTIRERIIAIAFGKWIDDKCIKNFEGYFFVDLDIPDHYVHNEYSIDELFEIFSEEVRTGEVEIIVPN
jgi:hypothetical protein